MLSTQFFELFDRQRSTVETHTESVFFNLHLLGITVLLTSHPLQAVCLISEDERRQESFEKLCERKEYTLSGQMHPNHMFTHLHAPRSNASVHLRVQAHLAQD